MQILSTFPEGETELRALGKLVPRFAGESRKTGQTAVPARALSFLAEEEIVLPVVGPAPYERITPLRNFAAAGV